jgi:hypothetical protein
MVSIVGFGRPKFKGAGKPAEKPAEPVSEAKTCPTCGQTVK